MYGSPQRHPQQQSNDLNLPYPPTSSQFSRNQKEDEYVLFHRNQQQQQQQQMSSGLLRYRSAPSTLLGELCEDFLPVRATSPETDTMFARLLASDLEKPSAAGGEGSGGQRRTQFEEVSVTAGFAATGPQQIIYQQQQQQMPSHSSVESSYRAVGSMGMDAEQIKNTPNLIRQSSSPAGLFSHLNVENGFGMMRGIGGFRNSNSPSGDSANRLKGQLSFPSRQNSIMSQISELESEEGMESGSPEDSGGRSFIPGFPIGSWDESSMLSENNFSGLKRGREGELKMLSGLNSSEAQNSEVRNHASVLSHQFSLPKTLSEIAAVEKFLQFQDSVPCKIRAKRGCATHPRSIAERVRRTKISERMRKLQELVPNMDKQTNTSDMLDLAVDYIKDLQKQVKALSDARASCTCSASNRKSLPNSSV